jgi:hypothetical protein
MEYKGSNVIAQSMKDVVWRAGFGNRGHVGSSLRKYSILGLTEFIQCVGDSFLGVKATGYNRSLPFTVAFKNKWNSEDKPHQSV